jgi:hypothetical protein
MCIAFWHQVGNSKYWPFAELDISVKVVRTR